MYRVFRVQTMYRLSENGIGMIREVCQLNRKIFLMFVLACLMAAMLVSGCAQSDQMRDTPGSGGVAGFWPGLWHGLILPVSFIVSLFDESVGIYEIHNNGNWYNFGFVIGASFMFGSVLASKKKK